MLHSEFSSLVCETRRSCSLHDGNEILGLSLLKTRLKTTRGHLDAFALLEPRLLDDSIDTTNTSSAHHQQSQAGRARHGHSAASPECVCVMFETNGYEIFSSGTSCPFAEHCEAVVVVHPVWPECTVIISPSPISGSQTLFKSFIFCFNFHRHEHSSS